MYIVNRESWGMPEFVFLIFWLEIYAIWTMAEVDMNMDDAEIYVYESFTYVPEAEWCKLEKYYV